MLLAPGMRMPLSSNRSAGSNLGNRGRFRWLQEGMRPQLDPSSEAAALRPLGKLAAYVADDIPAAHGEEEWASAELFLSEVVELLCCKLPP